MHFGVKRKFQHFFQELFFPLHNFDTIQTRGFYVHQLTLSVSYMWDTISFLHTFVTKVVGFVCMSIKPSLFYETQEFSVRKISYIKVVNLCMKK